MSSFQQLSAQSARASPATASATSEISTATTHHSYLPAADLLLNHNIWDRASNNTITHWKDRM